MHERYLCKLSCMCWKKKHYLQYIIHLKIVNHLQIIFKLHVILNARLHQSKIHLKSCQMNVFFSRLFWPLDKNCNQNRHGNRYVLLSKIPTYLQLPGSHIDLRMSCKNWFEKSCIILLLTFRLSLKINLFVSSRTADKNVANSVWFCDLQSFFRNNVDVRYFLSHY